MPRKGKTAARRGRRGRGRGRRNPPQGGDSSQVLIAGRRVVANRRLATSWAAVRRYAITDPTFRTVNSDPVADTFSSHLFAIGAVPYLVQQAALHEEYKIEGIRIRYDPLLTEAVAIAELPDNSVFTTPNIAFSFLPYSTVPTTWQSVASRGDAYICSTTMAWELTIHPKLLIRAFQSSLSDGFLPAPARWIACDNVDVPHYGFVTAIQAVAPSVGTSPTFGGRLTFEYYASFRNPRAPSGFSERREEKETGDTILLDPQNWVLTR